MKRKLTLILMAMVVTLSMLFVSPGFANEATKTVKVGSIMPISGPISFLGVGFNRGFELFFDKINKDGGLKIGADTYKFELITEDSMLSPEGASQAARKLVHKDGAKYVIGAILSVCAAAINEVTEPAGAMHVISWIDEPKHPGDVGPEKPLTVRPIVSSDAAYEMDYDYLRKHYPDAKRVVLVVDQGYEAMRARAKKVAEERGFEVVHQEQWPFGIEDFLPVYTRVMTHKPDAIHCMISAQAGDQLKAARQLGFKGPFFSDTPGDPRTDIIMQAGEEFSYDVFCNGMDMKEATPEINEIMKLWDAQYKEPFFAMALNAWEEVWILIQAMEKAQSVDPKKVAAAFDQMTKQGSVKTVFGPGRMGGAERFGVNRVLVRKIPITKIDKGKIENVGFFMPIVP